MEMSKRFVGLTLETAMHDAYVAGFPYHVALTAMYRVDGLGQPGTAYLSSVTETPELTLFSPPDAIGIELSDAAAGVLASVPPLEPPADRESGTSFPLFPNVPRRMLIDLSPYLGHVAPGRYLLRITYAADGYEVTTPPLPFVLRAPTEAEALLPHPAEGQSWYDWMLYGAGETSIEIARSDPARFNRVVRAFFRGESADLGVLDGLYAPEASAILLEMLAANGIDPTRSIAAVRERHPALGWWLDKIAAGEGPLTSMRQIVSP